MKIYVDLDDTLVTSELDFEGDVKKIYPRPGAERFLASVSSHGPVTLLTRADKTHVVRALGRLGPAATSYIKKVLDRRSLEPIEEKLEMIWKAPISDKAKFSSVANIKPLFPPGIAFDDQLIGSESYIIKTKAVGIGAENWIEVEPFTLEVPDLDGLKRAYFEFLRRMAENSFTLGAIRA